MQTEGEMLRKARTVRSDLVSWHEAMVIDTRDGRDPDWAKLRAIVRAAEKAELVLSDDEDDLPG